MSRLTAQIIAEVDSEIPPKVAAEIQRDAIPEEQAVKLLRLLTAMLLSKIVQNDVKGEIGFLYSPGLGVDIDMRKYDISILPKTRQESLLEQLQSLEHAKIHSEDMSELEIAIKIDLTVI